MTPRRALRALDRAMSAVRRARTDDEQADAWARATEALDAVADLVEHGELHPVVVRRLTEAYVAARLQIVALEAA